MTDPLHVAPGIVGILDAPNHVRIRAIRTERWIGFGRARRVVEHLSALCEYPPSTRPPALAIYGHSGMGKTMLVEKFRRDHPPAFNSAVGFETSPVLAISLTSRPTERRVYAQLLMALGVSVNERATLLELEIKAIRLLKDSMVRVLVFDEVHNLLAGSPREQRVILQLFRHLSNELKASLVCLGVADARDAIAGDVQLARRLDQLVLPRWKGDEEFQEMVTAVLASRNPPTAPGMADDQDLAFASSIFQAELRAFLPVELPERRCLLQHHRAMHLVAQFLDFGVVSGHIRSSRLSAGARLSGRGLVCAPALPPNRETVGLQGRAERAGACDEPL